MPAKSGKQYRFMQGVRSGNIEATGGLTSGKAKEIADATPSAMRIKWSKKKKKQ